MGGGRHDLLPGELITIVTTSIAQLVMVGSARRCPRAWPAVSGALLAALVVLGSFVYPVVVELAFYDFESLPDGALRAQVIRLAARMARRSTRCSWPTHRFVR